MRTTISIDDELLARLKERAARTGRTMSELVEDAVREMLARGRSHGRQEPIRLRTAGGSGPLPGVDLHDSAALLELMERER
jgi:Arc/MetJ family transcription regulator